MTCFAASAGLFAVSNPRPFIVFLAVLSLAVGIIFLAEAIRAWLAKPPAPRVVLNGPNAFHVKPVTWTKRSGSFETDVLGVILINDPPVRSESAVAKGLGVNFMCEEVGNGWMNARLDYSPQPKPGDIPQLRFDLGIGEWREFTLVVKEPELADCFLFNNDSYRHPRVQIPEWSLGPGEHRIVVKVDGVEVGEQFECVFSNEGQGGSLVVKSSRTLEP